MKKLLSLLMLLSLVLSANAWVVSGAGAILNGETWNHTSEKNTMTKLDNGTWQLVVSDAVVEKGTTYEWLVTDGTNWIKNGNDNYKLTVSETAKYQITYTLAADEQSATAEVVKTGEAGEITHTYSVAGQFVDGKEAGTPDPLFGIKWDASITANEMQPGNDNLYRWKAEGKELPAKSKIEFKIVVDHAWGQSYPSSNFVKDFEEAGTYDITITFNASTKAVNCTAEKKGDSDVESTFVVVGSSDLVFGTVWDVAAEANKMEKVDGIWTKEYKGLKLPGETIEWKVVQNGSTWIPDGEDNNLKVSVPESGNYDIIFTFDEQTQKPASKLMQNGKEITPTGEGWPANYGGVMIQAFYWNSYEDTQWRTLTEQADELSKYFDILWVPNSSNCVVANSMGYLPVYWLDHRSSFGSRERYLTEMITAFHQRGTKVIEDVVLNHKSPVGKNNSYIDFANEKKEVDGITYELNWTGADICNNDDGGYIKELGWEVTGAVDTGDDFSGARDLDHTSANVQQNCITYLNYLLNALHYDGFRLDMVKGYAPEYTRIYNEETKPEFCVGEYWDGYDNIMNWVARTGYTSAAFDFPLKYVFRDAFGGGDWSAFNSKGMAGDPNACRYAVTFVDNHDTYENEGRLVNGVLGANAFILAMPGTPCIFLKHWQRYPIAIGNMILARKAAGITNQSPIVEQQLLDGGYVIKVQGTKGTVLCMAGNPQYDTTGFTLIAHGQNFAYFVSDNVNVEGLQEGNDDEEAKDITVYVQADEAPYIYAWNASGDPVCGTWPGQKLTESTTMSDGTRFWTADFTKVPVNIIFNNGEGVQTANIENITHDSYFTFDATNKDMATNWTNITEKYYSPNITLPECAKPIEGHVYAYFQANKDYDSPYSWVWGNEGKIFCTNAEWPGDKLQKVGYDNDGHGVFLWDGGEIKEGDEMPTNILFSNNGSPKTDDFTFRNGGYYDATGFLASVIQGKKGDVNGDGAVDVADIASIISVMAGDGKYPNADVNGDKTVDVADIATVIDIMAH